MKVIIIGSLVLIKRRVAWDTQRANVGKRHKARDSRKT